MKKQQGISEQIRRHYAIEKQLAQRLRTASKKERRGLYAAVYDELFRSLPDHPQLVRKESAEESKRRVADHLRNLQPFLTDSTVFLEVGPGDCALSLEVAKLVEKVYAVDVSNEITRQADTPPNFQLILSDGSSIPVPAGTVDVVYSNQLMEHLHPDDALEQLHNIYRALRPGGIYICSTPNRLRGPHDISRFFDVTAQGLHLREYTVAELGRLFSQAGFSKQRFFISLRKIRLLLPVLPVICFEHILGFLPHALRQPLVSGRLMSELLGIRMVATK